MHNLKPPARRHFWTVREVEELLAKIGGKKLKVKVFGLHGLRPLCYDFPTIENLEETYPTYIEQLLLGRRGRQRAILHDS